MKTLLITTILLLSAVNVNAETKEQLAVELSHSLAESLVDMKLEAVCETYINAHGKTVLDANDKCASNVNELRIALESEPSAAVLADKVNQFMKVNNIPKND